VRRGEDQETGLGRRCGIRLIMKDGQGVCMITQNLGRKGAEGGRERERLLASSGSCCVLGFLFGGVFGFGCDTSLL
jgi:hypothetical protein